ncbi:leucine-rich repeat domain-containing protein [bacterium]|nr:leucine-rich repeat domain-containing protein [bacterium]
MRKTILISFFTLLGILSAHAYDFKVDGIYYNIISDTSVEVTHRYGDYSQASYSGSVVIPSTVTYGGKTYPVTTIGVYAFYYCKGLTSVTIPESVTSIGVGAFAGCTGLTSVTISEGVTYIGDGAFRGCTGLTSVTIPESVTTIGDDAFRDCTGLTSVTIPEGVTTIGDDAFRGCTGLTSVTIPESVTKIWSYAFYGCTSISSPLYNSKIFAYMPKNYSGEYAIPSGIQTIVDDAFRGCSGLTSVTIPESVTSTGDSAFRGCSSLTSVEWNAVDCPNRGWSYDISPFYGCKNIMSITFGNQVEYIPTYLCAGMNKLASVMIPNSVTSIGHDAFRGCSGLTSVNIPEGMTYIGYFAFRGCSGLTSVNILEGMTYIAQGTFQGCSGLTSVTIPKSVTEIYRDAFLDCSVLTSVISLARKPPYFEENQQSFFSIHDTLYVPHGCKEAYRTAQEWSEFSVIEELPSMGTATVTVRTNDASMGTVVGGGEYEIDEEITLEAIPNEGYHFVKWDDENTDNPRTLTVEDDVMLTAIFAKNEGTPDDPDIPTANENAEADNFRVYVQNRTIYLSEDRGVVQVYNMAGQCVYNGHATAIPVQLGGVYILVANDKRIKVAVK